MTASPRILAEFAQTARIGPIGCGAALPELVAALGQPFVGDPVDSTSRWPRWFGYGNLQLVVCRCRLVVQVIVPVWHGEIEVPDARTHAMVSHPSEVTYSQFTAALDAVGCDWRRGQDLPWQWTVESEVDGIRTEFVFVTTEGHDEPPLADPVLNKAVSSAFHDCPPMTPDQEGDDFGVA
ncbi:hypothetical protein [Streptomyces sp. A1-5]|uniref:hypothetical protein n=1 Tax=Streptomyces sp. A1-5 TaxID=2738410 RepID=UPI001F1EF2BC|nr:hypothetical protein [Streptomyces sp. A1-5]UJB40328.1 hypothetical protein HRD51_05215 [Streptomyces sp. A1-5]